MAEHRPVHPDHTNQQSVDADPVGLLYISDVQALKAADAVAFHTGGDAAWIHACLSGALFGEPRIYTARQQRLFPDADCRDRRRRITVAGEISGFDTHGHWHEHHLPDATAFTAIECAQVHDVWRSIAAFLRVGDVLWLHWRADNRADALTATDLYRDELSIDVQRGQRRWRFLLDVQIRPTPVRMISAASA
jgi:hypothetical protein